MKYGIEKSLKRAFYYYFSIRNVRAYCAVWQQEAKFMFVCDLCMVLDGEFSCAEPRTEWKSRVVASGTRHQTPTIAPLSICWMLVLRKKKYEFSTNNRKNKLAVKNIQTKTESASSATEFSRDSFCLLCSVHRWRCYRTNLKFTRYLLVAAAAHIRQMMMFLAKS